MLEFMYLPSHSKPYNFKAKVLDLVYWRKDFVQATGGLDDIFQLTII